MVVEVEEDLAEEAGAEEGTRLLCDVFWYFLWFMVSIFKQYFIFLLWYKIHIRFHAFFISYVVCTRQ